MPSMYVEVFKTNVDDPHTAEEILIVLREQFPGVRITFALDDCDRILRMAGESIDPLKVEYHMIRLGHFCEVLE